MERDEAVRMDVTDSPSVVSTTNAGRRHCCSILRNEQTPLQSPSPQTPFTIVQPLFQGFRH